MTKMSLRPYLVVAVVVSALAGAIVPASAANAAPSDFAAIDSYVQAQMGDAHIPGAALGIVHGGQVVHVRGFGQADASGRPVTGDTPFVIGSVSKSFTALAVMQLVEAGKVDLDAPARSYVPEFRLNDGGASDRITVRQLLNQTSGIPTQAGIDPLTDSVTSLDAQVRRLSTISPAKAPGAAYAYSNANYEVLGRLVELVSGQSYSDYLQQHELDPLGMSNTYTSVDAAKAAGLAGGCQIWFGVPQCLSPGTGFRPDFVPAGFVMSTANDMARYLQAQLDGGATVLSAAGIAEMHTPVGNAGLSAQGGGYGMGWFAGPYGSLTHTVWHNGSAAASHSMVLLLPESGWGVVLLTNAESLVYEMLGRIDVIAEGVAAQLVGSSQPGTLAGLYVAFDVFVALVTALQLRTIFRLVRRPAGIAKHRSRISTGLFEIAIPIWRELLVPISILFGLPAVLGAPWINLVKSDLGGWLLGMAALLLLTAAIRGYKTRVVWVGALARIGRSRVAPMRLKGDEA